VYVSLFYVIDTGSTGSRDREDKSGSVFGRPRDEKRAATIRLHPDTGIPGPATGKDANQGATGAAAAQANY